MILVLLAWCLLIFVGIGCNKQEFLYEMNIVALRGICAIEIMLGHIGIATGSIWLYPNRKAGILFVGVFFLLSGYGLAYSLKNKKNYLGKFLSKKIEKLILPAYFTFFSFECIKIIGGGYRAWDDILDPIKFFKTTNWYVWECLILYITFWFLFRFLSVRQAEVIMLLFSIGLIIICYLFNVSNPWYGSTICFWLGIKYYEKEMEIKHIYLSSKCKYYFINIMVLICSIGIFFILDDRNFVGVICARNVAAASFSILIVMLLYKINIGNKVSEYLGKISYEIFLIHPFVIEILRNKGISSVLYSCLVIAVTIAGAILLHSIESGLGNLWKVKVGN